jgi:photosystem II stability/assembly factor-like uncharacterized protein
MTAGLEHAYCRTIAIDAANPERLYTTGASSPPGAWHQRPTGAETALFRSDDGAHTWRRLRNGLPDTFRAYIDALVTDPQAPGTVAFATNDGEIYLSRDAGEHWTSSGQAAATRRLLVL